jgi:hypothetical protein
MIPKRTSVIKGGELGKSKFWPNVTDTHLVFEADCGRLQWALGTALTLLMQRKHKH